MKRLEKMLLTGWIILAAYGSALSQQTMSYQDPGATYRSALELFDKGKYAMARELFTRLAEEIDESGSLLKASSEYMAAVCGYELVNNNSDQAFKDFLETHEASSLNPVVCLQLGKLEYRKGNYHEAIDYLTRVDKKDLEDKALSEYLFKLGYSYFRAKKFPEADKTLASIKDINNVYYPAAVYFRSHIAYANQSWDKALTGFNELKEDPTFKSIVPYYIVQIQYLQKDFDNLLKTAPQLLSTANLKRGPEIARMIGEAHYSAGHYTEALPFLQQYVEKTRASVSREDYYQIAYASYKTSHWDDAIKWFNQSIGTSDTLSQNAFYHLGDCYLKKGEKKFALNAFQSAYKEGFDFTIKEDALFNYAKLSYELSYDPYNEAIRAIKQYIKEYPNSKRLDEANIYLVNLFMSTKNYKEALESLENITQKDQRLRGIYQRLNYFRGIEEFNNKNYTEAEAYFKKASATEEDKEIQSASLYWIAEGQYRREQYPDALEGYRQFQLTPGGYGNPLYYLADYNIGYCYFKAKDYEKAKVSFRKLITNKDRVDAKVLNDACNRAGDCYFITKNYNEAVPYYDQALALKQPDADYALFQKSLAQGAGGNPSGKALSLEKLIDTYPKSSLQAQAKYELGLTYLSLQEENKALVTFDLLMNNHPKSRYVKDALLRTGLIYYNMDENEKALEVFKKVTRDYSGTPESKEAFVSIRNIYVDMGKTDDYFDYIKNMTGSKVEDEVQDSITYQAAENQYMKNDCNSAMVGFRNYLSRFNPGYFRVQASFYLAECLFRNNQPEEALPLYLTVTQAPRSRFTETSLLNVSSIYFSRKDYSEALASYRKLLENSEYPANILVAQTGIMRCEFLLKNYDLTMEACKNLIGNEEASVELMVEAHLTAAKAALELNKTAQAQTEFETTYKMTKNEFGAEAKYYLSLIQFNQGNNKEAENSIFEFINEFPSYDYWLAKSFILLADVYVKTDNILQAKQTLQSIIDNYEGADLVQLAHEKLNGILAAEKEQEKIREEEARKAKEKEQETIKIEQETIIDNK